MKDIVKKLFDFQKFEENKRLAELIAETESMYMRELSDDELENIAAAGDIDTVMRSSKRTEGSRDD